MCQRRASRVRYGRTQLRPSVPTLLSRNGHTLVLSRHGDDTRGRWLDGMEWGSDTPRLMIDPDSVAMLSPSGRRIVIDSEK